MEKAKFTFSDGSGADEFFLYLKRQRSMVPRIFL